MTSVRRGFALIELVMVVVIIAVIAAIAIPRLSRGSAAASESALRSNLVTLNKALDHYAAEHDGKFPDAGAIADQLTMFTDQSGGTSGALSGTHFYGPYVRTIPPLPLGTKKGKTGIGTSEGPTIGWLYNPTQGTIRPAGTHVGGGAIAVGGATED